MHPQFEERKAYNAVHDTIPFVILKLAFHKCSPMCLHINKRSAIS